MILWAVVWGAVLGGIGLGIGMWFPIHLDPSTVQGPLVGVVLTGPVGCWMGLFLGGVAGLVIPLPRVRPILWALLTESVLEAVVMMCVIQNWSCGQ
jgi:hypothetical protein